MSRITKVVKCAKEVAAKLMCFGLMFTLLVSMGEGVTAAHLFPERIDILESVATEHTVDFNDLPFVDESEWDIAWEDEWVFAQAPPYENPRVFDFEESTESTNFNDMPLVLQTEWEDIVTYGTPVEDEIVAAFDMLLETDYVVSFYDMTPVDYSEFIEEYSPVFYTYPDGHEVFCIFDILLAYGEDMHFVSFYDMVPVTEADLLETIPVHERQYIWDDVVFIYEYEYFEIFDFMPFDMYGNPIEIVSIHDMPFSDEIWWEDDMFPYDDGFVGIDPLNSVTLPRLTVSHMNVTSTSVTLTGTITNAGGGAITARGFWIRPSTTSVHQEWLVNTTSNTFSMQITGLLPNTRYYVRSIARNSAGTGQSDAITFTTRAVAPSAPLNFRVNTNTPGTAALTWSAPSNNGGAAIIRYEVSNNNGSTWVTASGTTSHTFTGLTAGTRTFRVRAVNSVSVGAQSTVTGTVLAPVTLPSLTVSRGTTTATSVTLNGTITNNGGAAIIERGFWIRPSTTTQETQHRVSGSGNSFSFTITNLLPNTRYYVRAVATNSAGTGQSNAITFTTPAAPPSAPQGLNVVPAVGSATLTWRAPANNGGAAITRYEVSNNNGVSWVNVGTATSHTFTGLAAGSRTFSVRAVNAAGAGVRANQTITIPAAALPTLTITRGTTTATSVVLNGTITNNGGAAITDRGFWIRPSTTTQETQHRVSGSGNSFSFTITNLLPNTRYYVRAVATNSAGTGQSNAITFTTPIATPSVPLNFRATAGVGQVALTWSAPASNGGSVITRYEVSRDNGSTWISVGTATSHTFTNLNGGTAHTFRVRAVNAAGAGAQATVTSTPTVNPPTLTTTRGAVTSTTVVLNGNITNTGGANITNRGFWIRAVHETNFREVMIGGSANAFSHTITGLTPGVTYVARAVAVNSGTHIVGQGTMIEFTTPVAVVLPTLTVSPGAITNTSVVLNGTVTNNGGAAITNTGFWIRDITETDFRESWTGGTAHTFSQTITGLVPGRTYVVRAVARNSAGVGQSDVLEFVTTAGVPTAPRDLRWSASGSLFTLTWSVPANNGGSVITRYEVSVNNGAWVTAQGSTGHAFTGLAINAAHTFRVRAVTAAGAGAEATVSTADISVNFDSNGGWFVTGRGFGFDDEVGRVHEKTENEEMEMEGEMGIVPAMITFMPDFRIPVGEGESAFPRVERDGYTLIGWFLPPLDLATNRVWNITAQHQGQTFFAVWQRNPTIITPEQDGAIVFQGEDVLVQWQALPQGIVTYQLSVWNTTGIVRQPVITRQPVGHTAAGHAIPERFFSAGNSYEIEIRATDVASGVARVSYDTREIEVHVPPPGQGITITVSDAGGRPVPGALVHFLRGTIPVLGVETFFETRADGTVFFANAPAGTNYAVMVTHDDFVTTHETIHRFSRNSANQVQQFDFVFVEQSSTFRNIGDFTHIGIYGWADIFNNMGTVANPNYRISSIYGYREFRNQDGTYRAFSRHNGVDIIDVRGGSYTLGRRLNAPFHGRVVTVFNQQVGPATGRGHGLTMHYYDEDLRTDFYVSFYHMQYTPRRANGQLLNVGDNVPRGSHVGTVGGTPFVTTTQSRAVHLHVEVHRNFDHGTSSVSWEHLMDPRAFWTPQIFRPRHHGRTIHRQTDLVAFDEVSIEEFLPEYEDVSLGEELSQ